MGKNILKGEELEKLIDLNLGQLYNLVLKSHGDTVIQIDGSTGEKLSASTLLKRAIRVANFFREQGIGIGDSVSVMSENRLEFCIIPIAAFFVGATFAPFNPDYTPDELDHVMNLSKPKIVFASPNTVLKLSKMKNSAFLKVLFIFGSEQNNSSVKGFNLLIKDAENDAPVDFQVPPYDPKETVATILCSSGTTGMPKGVMCTHDNMTTFFDIGGMVFSRMIAESFEGGPTRSVGIVPFFHSFGFMTMIINILQGKTMVLVDKFKPKIFLDIVSKYKISRLMVPPPLLIILTKGTLAQKYDLSCVKEVIVGAAALSKDTEMELKKRFKIQTVSQSYGMTETTLAVTYNPFEKAKTGSVGKVVPGMMAKIIDENGNTLGPYKEGELCLKGPLIMKGYVNDEQATKDCIDEDGWLHTGDVAYYDHDKYIFIVDRLKELIKYKGFQVPPAELEAILLSHPAVMDAAVIGIPDEFAGELPLAYVVTKRGVYVSPEELQKTVADKVSPQKQLRGGVRFVKEIPRNPTGKILRRVLRKNALMNPKAKL